MEEPMRVSEHPGPGRGKVIPVGSTKGGVGKSTIAANLAVFLSRAWRTVLVDFDANHGDVSTTTYLDRPSKVTVANWESKIGSIEGLNSSPKAQELKVLPFGKLDGAFNGSLTLGTEILSTLRNHFDYVVVDLGVFADLWCINAAVNASDLLLLVASFIHLESNRAARGRMWLIVNKVGLEPIHTTSEIQRALGFDSHFEVPFDPQVGRAVMRKTFSVLLPKTKAGHAMLRTFGEMFEKPKGKDVSARRKRWILPFAVVALFCFAAGLGYMFHI